jgi:hypothetical protein
MILVEVVASSVAVDPSLAYEVVVNRWAASGPALDCTFGQSDTHLAN